MKANKKTVFGILNLLLIVAIFVGNYFYLTVGGIELKAACSGGFALLGILNLCYAFLAEKKNLRFSLMMALGLFLCMVGDIVIGMDFILGAAVFAMGHVCYFIAYLFRGRLTLLDGGIAALFFIGAGSFLLFCPLLDFPNVILHAVCFVYAIIISGMVGKAIGNFIHKPSLASGALALGSALFFFSDLMLVFDRFTDLWSFTGELCMGTYYPAQCLLALSVYLFATKDA